MDNDDGDDGDDDKSELQVVKVHFNFNEPSKGKKMEQRIRFCQKDNWLRMNEKMESDMHGISRARS